MQRASYVGNIAFITGATLYDSQTIYLAGSTALGHFASWNDGTGKLIVANIANPAAMTVVTQVNVPGIVNLYRPMVSGNRAIALGDGGTDISFPSPGTVTGLGNITIISPLLPAISRASAGGRRRSAGISSFSAGSGTPPIAKYSSWSIAPTR